MTPLDRLAAYIASLHPKWRDVSWGSMDEDTRELFREDARGALTVIREPSVEMLAATVQKVGDPSPEAWELADQTCSALCGPHVQGETAIAELARDWQNMIDAALTPPLSIAGID
jgi:hypothetical protein